MDDAAVLAPKDVSTLCRGGQLGPAFPPVLDRDPIRGRAVADSLPHVLVVGGSRHAKSTGQARAGRRGATLRWRTEPCGVRGQREAGVLMQRQVC